MAGDQGSAHHEAERKQDHGYPPEEDSTRHGSDPSRPFPPEPLYLGQDAFAAFWPGIEPRLYRRLVRDGLDPDSAHDLCQDVASAFLRAPQRVRNREELVELVLLAGYRLSARLRRRDARELLGDLPETVVPDVADEVERRFVVEALVDAFNALPDRDRVVLLSQDATSAAALSPLERNRSYVRLHRARRRLRERLRGWLVGVYVGRYLPLRDELFADGALRVVCLSAAALAVIGTSILHNSTSQPAAAAPASTQNTSAGVPRGLGAVGVAFTEPPVAHPTDGRAGPFRPEHKGVSGTTGSLEQERPSHSVTLVGAPAITQADAALNPRPPGDDSLICLSGLRVASNLCVEHPLRKDGESIVPHP